MEKADRSIAPPILSASATVTQALSSARVAKPVAVARAGTCWRPYSVLLVESMIVVFSRFFAVVAYTGAASERSTTSGAYYGWREGVSRPPGRMEPRGGLQLARDCDGLERCGSGTGSRRC